MSELEAEEIRRFLLEHAGCFEAYSVTTFKAYRREKKGGATQEVMIEILDAGPTKSNRYQVVATDQFGRVASGNSLDSLIDTLRITHWYDLDAPRSDHT